MVPAKQEMSAWSQEHCLYQVCTMEESGGGKIERQPIYLAPRWCTFLESECVLIPHSFTWLSMAVTDYVDQTAVMGIRKKALELMEGSGMSDLCRSLLGSLLGFRIWNQIQCSHICFLLATLEYSCICNLRSKYELGFFYSSMELQHPPLSMSGSRAS
jgi:hypothetical protein